MENDRFNRRLAEIENRNALLEELGAKHFDSFSSSVAEPSHIPEEFDSAVVNLGSEAKPEDEYIDTAKKIINNILGIKIHRDDEALYVITLGNAISLVKKL